MSASYTQDRGGGGGGGGGGDSYWDTLLGNDSDVML